MEIRNENKQKNWTVTTYMRVSPSYLLGTTWEKTKEQNHQGGGLGKLPLRVGQLRGWGNPGTWGLFLFNQILGTGARLFQPKLVKEILKEFWVPLELLLAFRNF